MEDKEQYTSEELIEKWDSLKPHMKTINIMIKGAVEKVFDDIENIDGFDNEECACQYKELKERSLTSLNNRIKDIKTS